MLPELKVKEFETNVIGKLRKVFMVSSRTKGDVVYIIRDKKTGKFILMTKRSQKRRISPWHLEQIKKQLYMTRSQFIDFRECPLSAANYRQILIKKGKI